LLVGAMCIVAGASITVLQRAAAKGERT
jgi:hypothetical protein